MTNTPRNDQAIGEDDGSALEMAIRNATLPKGTTRKELEQAKIGDATVWDRLKYFVLFQSEARADQDHNPTSVHSGQEFILAVRESRRESRITRQTTVVPVHRNAKGVFFHLGKPIGAKDLPWLINLVPFEAPDEAARLSSELMLKALNLAVEISGGDFSGN
jgi:hypothetical protein